MQFKIETQRLCDACKKASKIAQPESVSIHQLSGMHIQADAEKRVLRLICTDMTISIMLKLKEVNITKSGEVIVPARWFSAMLETMSDDELNITTNEKGLMKVRSGKANMRFQTLKCEDFPAVNIAFPDNTICVSGLSLISKLPVTIDSESTEMASFQGVQLKFSEDVSAAVSTDGVRFVKSKRQNIADGELDITVPERSLKLLCGIIKPNDDIYI